MKSHPAIDASNNGAILKAVLQHLRNRVSDILNNIREEAQEILDGKLENFPDDDGSMTTFRMLTLRDEFKEEWSRYRSVMKRSNNFHKIHWRRS